MKIWICIPVHNRIEYTLKCLNSIRMQSLKKFKMVICDDGSTDGSKEKIRKLFPETKMLVGDGNLWWTGAINRCVEYVIEKARNEDVILTLNNDLEVPSNYLEQLIKIYKRYPGSIVSSSIYDIATNRLYDPGHRHNWLTAKFLPIDQTKENFNGDREAALITHAPGRGTLISVEVFKKIGLYDEKHLPHYAADYDFTFRASKNGYRILIAFKAKVLSHVNETGLADIRKQFSIKGFVDYLTGRKSPANIRNRFWMAVNNCPQYWLPTYLIIDILRVTGSYFKFHLQR